MNGNLITTQIGSFRKRPSKKGKRGEEKDDSINSKSPKKKKKANRHRVTFGDEVSGSKKNLLRVHYIESYKKYNQEFYNDQVQGCCTIF